MSRVMKSKRKLRKSRNRVLAGVAAGIAEFINWKPHQIRAVWLLLGLFTGGGALLAYAVCAYCFSPPTDFDVNEFRVQ